MYQQLTLVGNLGSTPEMRYTPSGVAVTSFRLAVNRNWTSSEGEQKEKTTWFNITCWRGLAETVNQYLDKGRQVLVVGTVDEARPWVDREGNQRASIEITADEVRFLGAPSAAMNGTANRNANNAKNGEPQAGAESVADVPF